MVNRQPFLNTSIEIDFVSREAFLRDIGWSGSLSRYLPWLAGRKCYTLVNLDIYDRLPDVLNAINEHIEWNAYLEKLDSR